MKALLLNGSPHEHGTTRRALDELAEVLKTSDVDTEILTVGDKPVRGCIACGKCNGRCVAFNDDVNRALDRMERAQALVIASPVYFASPNGALLCFLDRMFSAGDASVFGGKPAACIAVARRAGTTASLDVLMKYPAIIGMPIVTSTYWNMAFGSNAGQAEQDEEGLQSLRNLGANLVWLLNCIEAGKRSGLDFPKPKKPAYRTDFIR